MLRMIADSLSIFGNSFTFRVALFVVSLFLVPSAVIQIFIKVTLTLAPELLGSTFNVGDGPLKSWLVPGLGGHILCFLGQGCCSCLFNAPLPFFHVYDVRLIMVYCAYLQNDVTMLLVRNHDKSSLWIYSQNTAQAII